MQSCHLELEKQGNKAQLGWAVLRIRTGGIQRVCGKYNSRPLDPSGTKKMQTSFTEHGIQTSHDPPLTIGVDPTTVNMDTITTDPKLKIDSPLLHFHLDDKKIVEYLLLAGQHRFVAAEQYLAKLDEQLEGVQSKLENGADGKARDGLKSKEAELTKDIQFGSRWWVKVYDSGE